MKIPESVLKSMMELVVKSLPYESEYDPKTPEAIAVEKIALKLSACDPMFHDLLGPMRMYMKSIDRDPPRQQNVRGILVEMHAIIHEYDEAFSL